MGPDPYESQTSLETAFRRDILEKVSPARLLVLLAGSCAIVLGLLAFVLQFTLGPRIGPLNLFGTAPLVMMLLIDLAFGAFLLYAYASMTSREVDWAVIVFALALVLVVLGGIAGAVAGILAGVGALSVMIRAWRRPTPA